jgi:hypothetical protein
MRSILSSPRRRRRLITSGFVLLGIIALVGVSVAVLDTGPKLKIDKSVPSGPIPTGESEPKPVPFTRSTERAIMPVLKRFVDTAVVGQNVAASYDLATPSLHEGMSREEWAGGNIPVQPYPARRVSISRITGSFKRDVQFEASLEPKPGAHIGVMDVQVEMKELRGRWLVDSFATSAVLPAVNQPPPRTGGGRTTAPKARKTETKSAAPDYGAGHLGKKWLLLPAAIFGLIILVPLTLAVTGWYRRRQAYRQWTSE